MGGADLDTHFVDTNILIGYTVEWDRLGGTVGRYLDAIAPTCSVYSSPRAVDEALYVVRKQRQLAKHAARIVHEDYERADAHDEIEHIKKFVVNELANESGDTTGLGGVQALIEEMDYTFEGLTKVNSRNAFDTLLEKIDCAFESPVEFLEKLEKSQEETAVKLFHETASDYHVRYQQYSVLDDLFEGEPRDRNLLFDAFHLLTTMGLARLCFVTDDREHFISNRDKIQESLRGIVVSRPDEATAE